MIYSCHNLSPVMKRRSRYRPQAEDTSVETDILEFALLRQPSDGELLQIFFGAGYRIYYGIAGTKVVLLLTGGSKKGQSKDIKAAQRFWVAYQNEQEGGS